MAELIIAKQRNGPTDVVRLSWNNSTTRFQDFSAASPPGGYSAPNGAGQAVPSAVDDYSDLPV